MQIDVKSEKTENVEKIEKGRTTTIGLRIAKNSNQGPRNIDVEHLIPN